MTGGMMFKAALISALMVTPALADGKQETMAVINMAIAQQECGLTPDAEFAKKVAERSLQFTGLDRDTYIRAVSEAVVFETERHYQARTIGRFCAGMARVYLEGK